MPENVKTSTFTIHHDRCKPEDWRPKDVLALAEFVRTGDMRHAAKLSRLGVQLVLSEHHQPKGGELQQVGWVTPGIPDDVTDDLDEIVDENELITEIVPVFFGQVRYAVGFLVGDEDGNIEGREIETFDNDADASAFLKSLHAAAPDSTEPTP